MKKLVCIVGFLTMAAQLPLWCYDSSPSFIQIVPEVVYAPATGGGAWVTELQITSFASTSATVSVYFDYAGGWRGPFLLYTGLEQYRSVRYSNILAELQALDPSFTYYGRVGSLFFQTESVDSRIQVQAKTINGNYGKTLPGLSPLEGNTAAEGRPMILQDLVQNATYRTFVGLYNAEPASITVTLTIVDANNFQVGTPFIKTLNGYGFVSFNPFNEAGVPSGTFSNCWLHINVTSGGSSSSGLMSFGSIANNYTNDTYALIAKMLN